MERLTYDYCVGDIHCWQVKGADNRECRQVCEEQGKNGCKGCPIALAFDRLAAYEDTGLAPEEVQIQKEAMERMGWFGKMFQRYAGDPRGPIGTIGNALEKFLVKSCIEPARNRQVLKDVDGNTWLPMLQDEFRAMEDFIERVQGWIPVEERLPDKPGHYLVCTNVNYWHGGCMDKNGSSSNAGTTDGYAGTTLSVLDCFYDITGDWNRVCNAHVTHWMPLPQPPKEEAYEK